MEGKKPVHSHVFEIVVIAILLVILIIVVTMCFYYGIRKSQCYSYASPWCYKDFACCDNIDEIFTAQKAKTTLPLCINPIYKWDLLQDQKLAAVPVSEGKCTGDDTSGCINPWTKGDSAFFNSDGQPLSGACTGPGVPTGVPCNDPSGAYNNSGNATVAT